MKISVNLDDTIGQALQRLAKRRRTTRNALIRKAVEDLVSKETGSPDWTKEVLERRGEPAIEPLESRPGELSEPAADPLSAADVLADAGRRMGDTRLHTAYPALPRRRRGKLSAAHLLRQERGKR